MFITKHDELTHISAPLLLTFFKPTIRLLCHRWYSLSNKSVCCHLILRVGSHILRSSLPHIAELQHRGLLCPHRLIVPRSAAQKVLEPPYCFSLFRKQTKVDRPHQSWTEASCETAWMQQIQGGTQTSFYPATFSCSSWWAPRHSQVRKNTQSIQYVWICWGVWKPPQRGVSWRHPNQMPTLLQLTCFMLAWSSSTLSSAGRRSSSP